MTTRPLSFKSYVNLLAWSLFLTSFLFSSLNAQCPTVTNNLQTFCDVESILVGDLVASDNGGGIVWYETSTSTTPLLDLQSLVDGEDYYADDTSGNCGPRQRVDVIIYGKPIGQNFQGVCLDDASVATIADLVATGNDVQWYLTQFGGTPLSESTVLVDEAFYYADQANPETGCRTSRLSVQVNVGFTPIPTGDSIQEFCITPDITPTVDDLIASGNNNWYISLFSALPLPPTTPLIDGQVYYASTIDPPCESSTRLAVLALITESPDPGTNANLDLCENDNIIDLFTVLGGNPEPGGTWSPTLNSNTGVFNPAIDPSDTYTYTIAGVAPCVDTSATVTVSIIPEPIAGENGSVVICDNSSNIFLFDFLQGAPQSGGTWSPALASGTDEFNPAVDPAIVYTYTVAGVAPCNDESATVTVSVIPQPNAGENGAVEICGNGDNIFLFDFLQGAPQSGGTWSPALASGTDEFNPAVDPEAIYTYTITGIPPCEDDTATVQVTIITSVADAGENGSVEVCSNSNNIFLFDFLQGTPQSGGTWSPALASGTDEFNPSIDPADIYTYTIEGIPPCEDASATVEVTINIAPDAGENGAVEICSNSSNIFLFDLLQDTPQTGGTWSPALASGTDEFDPTIDPAVVYTYTVTGSPPCEDDSATVTVTLTPEPDAGENGSVDVCSNGGTIFLFDFLQGTPQSGGTWSPALASGTDEFNPAVDSEDVYTYTITGTPPCEDDSATVTVTIVPAPDAGEDGAVEICTNGDNIFLFDFLQGTPQTGGTWSPALASGTDEFDPAIDPAVVYTYTVTGSPPCEDDSATVTVTLTPEPDAGENGSVDVCSNGGTIFLFDFLQGTPQSGGTWSPALASGTDEFNPSLDVAGVYTYTITGTPPCENDSATVTVTIVPAPDAGEDGAVEICTNGDNIFLFDFLQGTPQTGGTWSPALASGTDEFDPAIDPAVVYTYTVTGSPPCEDDSATVTVTLTPEPDAGENGSVDVCSNGGTIFLFDFLQGTPQSGGTWSPALTSGTDEFNPAIDSQDVYTYTITGTPPCEDDSATVTVTIVPAPDAGEDGAVEICTNGDNVFLFDFLQGTPQSGGTWSPALASGTDEFDPLVDSADIYTYTVAGSAPCEDDSATVTVTLAPEPDAGENGTAEICTNSDNIFLFDFLQGTPQSGGTWSPELASGTDEFNPSLDVAGIYTYTISAIPTCDEDSATVTVTVLPGPDAGEDGTVEVCINGNNVFLFDFLQGTPEPGGSWSPALASGTDEYNPAVDPADVYTYTVAGSAPCEDDSATVTVTLAPEPDAGENGTAEVCTNSDNIFLFDFLQGTPQSGGTWSPELASGTDEFNPSLDVADIYTYTISAIPTCDEDSATVTVTVLPGPDAGEDGTAEVCISGENVFLFDFLLGTPEAGGSWSPALASGTDEYNPTVDPADIYTYTVAGSAPCEDDSATVTVTLAPEPDAGENGTAEVCTNSDNIFLFDFLQGTPQSGGTWSPELASGTDEFNPSLDVADTYTYTIAGIPPCDEASATVTVTIIAAPDPGENGSIEVCSNGANIFLFDVLEGTPQSGGTWSPALSSGTDEFDPSIDTADIYTYTIAGIPPCEEASATVTVTFIPDPDAGEDSTTNICIDAGLTDLFDFLGPSADPGGTWFPTLNSGTGLFDPTIDPEDTYTYTVRSSECNLRATATVTVTIGQKPDVAGTILATDTIICIGSDVLVNISGATELADGNYTIDYVITGENEASVTVDILVSGGNSSFIIPLDLIPNSGVSLVTITGFYFAGENCSGDTDLIASLEINILETRTPQLSDEGNQFCSQDNPTISDLSSNVLDSEPIIWYDLPLDGTPYSDSDPLIDGTTYYGALQGSNGCESFIRLEVTVSVIECEYELIIPDGFSPNNDGINDDFNIVNLNILYPNFKLSIYNRYGNILYEGDINSQRWDGKSKNSDKVLPIGVYFFILEFNDGELEPIQGRVYLSR